MAQLYQAGFILCRNHFITFKMFCLNCNHGFKGLICKVYWINSDQRVPNLTWETCAEILKKLGHTCKLNESSESSYSIKSYRLDLHLWTEWEVCGTTHHLITMLLWHVYPNDFNPRPWRHVCFKMSMVCRYSRDSPPFRKGVMKYLHELDSSPFAKTCYYGALTVSW